MTLPFDLAAGQAVFLVLALLAAAFVRGYSGFGFAALTVASAALVTNPLLVVPVVLLADLAMSAFQARGAWRDVDWRRTLALFLGALVGTPLGIWALTGVGIDLARAIISVYVLGMCGVMMAGFVFRKPVATGWNVPVGVVSGMANAAAVGGLPVAAFFAAQPVAAGVFRSTLIAYFTLLDLWSLPLMWRAGLVVSDTWAALVVAVPVVALGSWLGGRHFFRSEPQSFRRFAIGLLAVLAVLGLLKSVL